MTAPKPMTADDCIEALCEAQANVIYALHQNDDVEWGRAVARRDAIKAAMVAFVDACNETWNVPCDNPECDCSQCLTWRKLEEACRGK